MYYGVDQNLFQASATAGCQLTCPCTSRTDATVPTTTCVTQCVKAGRPSECRVLFALCGVRKATLALSETKHAWTRLQQRTVSVFIKTFPFFLRHLLRFLRDLMLDLAAVWRDSLKVSDVVDGGWQNWSKWGECSEPCGRGEQVRSRSCDNPRPKNGGSQCDGPSTQRLPCSCDPKFDAAGELTKITRNLSKFRSQPYITWNRLALYDVYLPLKVCFWSIVWLVAHVMLFKQSNKIQENLIVRTRRLLRWYRMSTTLWRTGLARVVDSLRFKLTCYTSLYDQC